MAYQSCDSAASAGGADEIYVADPRELYPRRLTHNASQDEFPRWSPDGRRIAFQSDRSGAMQIYVMDDTGGHVTQLTHSPTPCQIGGWSPDGASLAFCSVRGDSTGVFPQILTVSVVGAVETQLSNGPGRKSDPAWSPAGDEIAFLQDGGVYRVAGGGGRVVKLAEPSDSVVGPLEWSVDGRFLFFTLATGGRTDVCRITREGTGLAVLTSTSVSASHPAVLPDGEQIAYVEDLSVRRKVFLMDIDGYGRRPVTSLMADEGAPVGRRWSVSRRRP